MKAILYLERYNGKVEYLTIDFYGWDDLYRKITSFRWAYGVHEGRIGLETVLNWQCDIPSVEPTKVMCVTNNVPLSDLFWLLKKRVCLR